MNNIDKVVDLLYSAYEECGVRIDTPEEYDKKFKKAVELLNKEQKNAFYDYHFAEFEFGIEREKNVIKFILNLMCPEY